MSLSNSEILLQPVAYRRSIIAHIWEEYSNYSVEAISANRAGVYDFAEQDCMYFAVIKRFVKTPILETDEEGNDFYASASEDETDPWEAPAEYTGSLKYKGASGDRFIVKEDTIGLIYLVPSQLPSCVNLGCFILPDMRGQGYGSQAVRLLLGWAFEEIGCHRVQVRVADGDPVRRSRATSLLLSLGFVSEGTARRSLFCPLLSQEERNVGLQGEWKDVLTYAMLDTDWVIHKELTHIPSSLVKMRWEELFRRHDRERSETLAFEESQERKAWKARAVGKQVKRTTSTETIKTGSITLELDGAPNQSDKQGALPHGATFSDNLHLAETTYLPGPAQDEIDDMLSDYLVRGLAVHQPRTSRQHEDSLTPLHLSLQGHHDPFSYISPEDARYRSLSPSVAGVTFQSEDELRSSASSPLLPLSPLMHPGTSSGSGSDWESASVPRSPSVVSSDGSSSSWDFFEPWETPVNPPSVRIPPEHQ